MSGPFEYSRTFLKKFGISDFRSFQFFSQMFQNTTTAQSLLEGLIRFSLSYHLLKIGVRKIKGLKIRHSGISELVIFIKEYERAGRISLSDKFEPCQYSRTFLKKNSKFSIFDLFEFFKNVLEYRNGSKLVRESNLICSFSCLSKKQGTEIQGIFNFQAVITVLIGDVLKIFI